MTTTRADKPAVWGYTQPSVVPGRRERAAGRRAHGRGDRAQAHLRECGYWACIPSKTLLRPPEARTEVDRTAGVAGAALDWPPTRAYRDYMIRDLDDSNQVRGYEEFGATVIKGVGRITGPGTVEVDGRVLTAEREGMKRPLALLGWKGRPPLPRLG